MVPGVAASSANQYTHAWFKTVKPSAPNRVGGMSSIRHISTWKCVISVLYSVTLDRKRSFFLVMELQLQRGLIQLSTCPLGACL